MNYHVREEPFHVTNDWYEYAYYIEPGNRVMIVQEGHLHNNMGGSVVAIDTQMGTITIVIDIINEEGSSYIVIERENFHLLPCVCFNLEEYPQQML